MSKRYRELLPLPDGVGDPWGNQRSSLSHADPYSEPTKRKRVGTQLACNECRRRKARCNGQRPTCDNCLKREVTCTYSDRPDKDRVGDASPESSEILDLLKTAPESKALDILRILRANGDPATVLSLFKGREEAREKMQESEMKQDPSIPRKGDAPFSSAQYTDFELELMARNPTSYPAWRPPAASVLEESNLVHPFSLRRTRSFDQRMLVMPQERQLHPAGNQSPDEGSHSESSNSPAPKSFVTRLREEPSELQSRRYCDPRLENADIGFWTDVQIPNNLAGRIISLYLETDHPLLGTFDPDLFVSDFVNKETRFCSPLLVTAIMHWGCPMYSAIDPAASAFTPIFEAEADKHWATEKENDTVLNLAAFQLMSLAALNHGKDHFVLKHVSTMNRMGKQLGLFGLEPAAAAKRLTWVSDDLQSAASYAAWGAFNWTVLMALFYQQPGLEYPDDPPTLAIPSPGQNASCSSSSSASSIPDLLIAPVSYMGETFPALCRFWRIVHGITTRYYKNSSSRRPPSDHVTLEFAEHKYRELLAWAETLPSSLIQSERSPHHVVIFHIWFHAAVLDIFRPFIKRRRSERFRLKTFSSTKSSPDAAYKASVNQLKRLIILFRSRYPSSAYTMLWHTALIYVANAVLQDTRDSEWRSYFLLCIYGYENLRQSYRVAEAIGRGLLSMTLRNGDLTPGEARQILRQLQERGLSGISGDLRATFMVDLNLAMTDPDKAKVESLAHNFEDMALFQEFTNFASRTAPQADTDSNANTPMHTDT